MPSGTFVDLTLGGSGSSYTAPANGYYVLEKEAGFANAFCGIRVSGAGLIGMLIHAPSTSNIIRIFVPVKKGNICYVLYNATGATNYFRFIYADGEV